VTPSRQSLRVSEEVPVRRKCISKEMGDPDVAQPFIRVNPRRSVAKKVSDIQVLHIQRVFFNELAAGFHILAHQRGEDGLALGDIFQFHR